ncbi:hypothetical protein OIU85_003845 [Salix viminalis]|uniref:Bulb-type lectin domain-containing protein n=1 Tax=Salix viminalis TaxID=40686 RepID=A0A9Q0T1H5_SALVM|nr:hypothetical protein OIU85_003845 [Salix viminalis]
MGSSSLFLFFSSALLPYLCLSGPITIQTIKQPFTASHFQYIDQSGVFLISSNGNFTASISNFCITHVISNAIIWIANRNHPISDSDTLYLTANGLAINTADSLTNTTVAWSTQGLNSSSQVSAMELQDTGFQVCFWASKFLAFNILVIFCRQIVKEDRSQNYVNQKHWSNQYVLLRLTTTCCCIKKNLHPFFLFFIFVYTKQSI